MNIDTEKIEIVLSTNRTKKFYLIDNDKTILKELKTFVQNIAKSNNFELEVNE